MRDSFLDAANQPAGKGDISGQKHVVDRPAGNPLAQCRFGFAGDHAVDAILLRDIVIEIARLVADRVVDGNKDVHEILIAGKELPGWIIFHDFIANQCYEWDWKLSFTENVQQQHIERCITLYIFSAQQTTTCIAYNVFIT